MTTLRRSCYASSSLSLLLLSCVVVGVAVLSLRIFFARFVVDVAVVVVADLWKVGRILVVGVLP
jgi:hypothetical protein